MVPYLVDHQGEYSRSDFRFMTWEIGWLGALESPAGVEAAWREASVRLAP